jgi:hypothetical protein
MKTAQKLISLIAILFVFGINHLEAADVFNVAWLRKGCTAIIVGTNDKSNFSTNQATIGSQVIFWLNGFVTGANSMCSANEESEHNSKLTFPPEDWIDNAKLAPMILTFLRENPKVKDSAKARELMMAFYYMKHPYSTTRQKDFGAFLLEKTYK